MLVHIDLLLWLVEGCEAMLEEVVLNPVVFFQWVGDLLGRLIVAERPGLRQNHNIRWRVNFLEDHFELVQQSKGVTALTLHDLVHAGRIKLDIQVAQRWLQLFEVLHFMSVDVSVRLQFFKVTYLVEKSSKSFC